MSACHRRRVDKPRVDRTSRVEGKSVRLARRSSTAKLGLRCHQPQPEASVFIVMLSRNALGVLGADLWSTRLSMVQKVS